jgi:hypothetical protein
MPFPGRCVSAGALLLNYGAINVALLRKTNLSSRRRGDAISERINGLETNRNVFMGLEGARNQERLCWRGQQQITALLCSVFKGLIEAKLIGNLNTVHSRRTTYHIWILYIRTQYF